MYGGSFFLSFFSLPPLSILLLLGADGGVCFCSVLFRLFLGELVDERHYDYHHHRRRDE